jgi:large subunit ribosomal protein L24
MLRIKKGDSVKVVSGNYKGQKGRVLGLIKNKDRILVEGINKVKKHTKPSQDNPQGGIVEKELSIHKSNVMLLDKNNPVKVSFKVLENGKKIRVNKSNGKVIK